MLTNEFIITKIRIPQQNMPKLAADILIVDDTVENLKLLSKMLCEQGYKVRKATTGEMALKATQTLPPELILLDIMMPGLDGFEVCKTLKSKPETANIPVIFLSALDDTFDRVTAFKAGGADYISKPFQVEEVLLRVHHHLALRAAQKEISNLNTRLEAQLYERAQQLTEVNHQLQETQRYDELTGLSNRTVFIEQASQALQQCYLEKNFAIIVLDCDRFQAINDSLGHLVGDQLLKEIAKSLSAVIGPNDVLARLGGDEFGIILNNITGLDQTIAVAEQILASLTRPFQLQDYEIFVNVSIGLVLSDPAYQQPEQLIRDAGIALHQAQKQGQRAYQIFDAAMHREAERRLNLEIDLHRAIKQQEFVVHYQPIVNLETGDISALEALVRWSHPDKGLVPPEEFLTVAEETGLVCSIGRFVMEQACHQLQQWHQAGFPHLTMFINLSAQQLNQPSLIQDIDHLLNQTHLSPSSIKLEITESSMVQNLQTTMRILNQLRERGIQLSIDDFGTGYSSLGQLHTLPVNTLKVDRTFTHQLDGNPETLGIVPVIFSIAQVMNMDVVAKGIETEQQLAQLRDLGCQFGQGYLFAKPQDVQTVTELLNQKLALHTLGVKQ